MQPEPHVGTHPKKNGGLVWITIGVGTSQARLPVQKEFEMRAHGQGQKGEMPPCLLS